jgi:hypothetical protein
MGNRIQAIMLPSDRAQKPELRHSTCSWKQMPSGRSILSTNTFRINSDSLTLQKHKREKKCIILNDQANYADINPIPTYQLPVIRLHARWVQAKWRITPNTWLQTRICQHICHCCISLFCYAPEKLWNCTWSKRIGLEFMSLSAASIILKDTTMHKMYSHAYKL